MMKSTAFILTTVFMKIFLRDRQAIFFIIAFPIIFMLALGYGIGGTPGPSSIGVVNFSDSEFSNEFVAQMKAHPSLRVTEGDMDAIKILMDEKKLSVALIIPQQFSSAENNNIELMMDSSQAQGAATAIQTLRQALVDIERIILKTGPLFKMQIKDIQSRSLRYIDFLLPGLLALTLMQISIAGSGFNIVEFRRKGILKRLFVTPIRPRDFIVGVVNARLFLCLLQITVMILVAVYFMDVTIAGSLISLYVITILGAVIFLCIGFTLGSVAKTQQSIQGVANLVIFPQMLLSGIFYPIESLPDLLQPVASALPLSFIATAMREISTNGVSIFDLGTNLLGIAAWLLIGYVVSIRYFVWKDVAN